jgi:hypothetical protein
MDKELVKKAILGLDKTNPELWDESGLPKLDALKFVTKLQSLTLAQVKMLMKELSNNEVKTIDQQPLSEKEVVDLIAKKEKEKVVLQSEIDSLWGDLTARKSEKPKEDALASYLKAKRAMIK